MLNKMKISTKLYFGFGLLLALIVGLVLTGLWGVRQVNLSLQESQNFGLVSDEGNLTLIDGQRAKIASALHTYRKLPSDFQEAAKMTREVKTHLDDAKQYILKESMLTPDETRKFIVAADDVVQAVDVYEKLESQYAELEKERSREGEAFGLTYERMRTTLGTIIDLVDKPYAEELLAQTANHRLPKEAKLSLVFYRMKNVARDARGALTELNNRFFKFDTYVEKEKGDKAAGDVQDQLVKLSETIKAFETLPFEKDIVKLLDVVRNDYAVISRNIGSYIKATQEQYTILDGKNAQENEFDQKCAVFMELVEQTYQEAEVKGTEAAKQSMILVLVFGGIAFLLGVVIAVAIAKNISRGISSTVVTMTEIAQSGDLSLNLDGTLHDRYDEVGDLARAFETMMNQFRHVEKLSEMLAAGNWNAQVTVRGKRDDMNIYLGRMLEQVNEALHEVTAVVRETVDGTLQLATASDSLAQGATTTAASIEEITASVNEMGAQTGRNAEDADQADQLARQTNNTAASGQKLMEQMIASMEHITKNASDVQKVVKVIDDISFQTNLLALNAAVEAARAGVHGKGFAVVAEEVRNLAARSAKAAAETTEMIENNNRQIQAGADIASQTGEMLTTIVEQATKVAGLIGNIAGASQQQALYVAQVSSALKQIESATQQNTANAEESAAASAQMNMQARKLNELLGKFQLRD